MSEIKYKKVKISQICIPAKADKTLTRAKAKEKEGGLPVYAGTIGEPFAYVNDYNNTQPALVVVNDGDAGSTYIVNDTIPIPVKSDGTFDLEKQKELAAKYEQIETIKSELIERINNLTSIIVTE